MGILRSGLCSEGYGRARLGALLRPSLGLLRLAAIRYGVNYAPIPEELRRLGLNFYAA